MNSYERLCSAFLREPVDRLPVWLSGLFPYLDEDGQLRISPSHLSGPLWPEMEAYYLEKADLVGAWFPYPHPDYYTMGSLMNHAKIIERDEDGRILEERDSKDEPSEGLSSVRITEKIVQTPKGPLAQRIKISADDRCVIIKHWIENDEDLDKFFSIPFEEPYVDFDCFFVLKEKVGNRGIIRPLFLNAANCVYTLLGSEKQAFWSVERRSTLCKMLDIFQDRLLQLVRRCLRKDIGRVVNLYGQYSCLPPLQSPNDFREFVLGYDKKVIDLLHANDILVAVSCHSNKLKGVLDDYSDMGADILYGPIYSPWSDITPDDIRNRLSPQMAIEGGIALTDIYSLNKDDMIDKISSACQAGIQGLGLVLTTDAAPIVGGQLTRELFESYRIVLDYPYCK